MRAFLHAAVFMVACGSVWAGNQYVRPAHADNGSPWPAKSGYVKGYSRGNTDGNSMATIDNTKGKSDVFAKLYFLEDKTPRPVRVVFVRASESFTMKNLRPGLYDLRYRDLDTGELKRSDPIGIDERRVDTQVEYTDLRITLYKVSGGKISMHDLAETEFQDRPSAQIRKR